MWSAAVRRRFRKKKGITKIVSDTEGVKNTPTHVRAKTDTLCWPSTVNSRISSVRNFLPFNHYFRKYIKLVYRKNVVMVTLITGIIFSLFMWMHFWVGNFTKVLRVCADQYEVVRDCQKFNPLRPNGNYMNHLLWQSLMLNFVFTGFVWFSLQTAIISLNSVNQLIFVIVKYGVLFEVRTGFLNNI
jgi:hypothetical protein